MLQLNGTVSFDDFIDFICIPRSVFKKSFDKVLLGAGEGLAAVGNLVKS
jgi:hypothetical protein